MRAIRLSLLEADVSLPVVKQLTTAIAARAKGAEVMDSLTPDQQVVKIVSEELTTLMGEANVALPLASKPPTIVLMAGLQGSGKTTCSAKLARYFRAQGRAPMLVACDVHRPAAAEQLAVLGEQIDVPVHREEGRDAVAIARNGIEAARRTGRDLVIVDTAGRLTIDAEMMDELVRIKDAVEPTSVVLVVDAMTGQTAVDVAKAFGEAVDFDGVALTKLDGDARGGAALSVRAVSGKPILFIGTGEKLEALEPFHPDRMASRILGMGDVLSLIEKAQTTVDVGDAKKLEEKIRGGSLTLEDFLEQMHQVRRMGPMSQVLGHDPGLPQRDQGQGPQPGRSPDRPRGGHHQEHDAPGAPPPRDHQRQPPAPHRVGQRHQRAGGQPAPVTVQADAKADEADGPWRPARPLRHLTETPSKGSTVVKIRLARVGGKKNAIYRVVVADVRSPRDGRNIETIGRYNPQTAPVDRRDRRRQGRRLDLQRRAADVGGQEADQDREGRGLSAAGASARSRAWSARWRAAWWTTPSRWRSRRRATPTGASSPSTSPTRTSGRSSGAAAGSRARSGSSCGRRPRRAGERASLEIVD